MKRQLTGTLLHCLFLFAFSLPGTGQESDLPPYYYPSRTYTASDGLSQTYTYRVMQDSKGYIWVGTREGINKFDGIQFENHLNNSWFPDDKIGGMAEDENQHIWFIGEKGLYKYNGDTIINYFPDTFKNLGLNRLVVKNSDEIWVSTQNALYIFKNGVFTEQQLTNLPFPNFVITRVVSLEKGSSLLSLASHSNEEQRLFLVDSLGQGKIIAPGKQKVFNLISFQQNSEKLYIQFDQSIYTFHDSRFEHIVDAEHPFSLFTVQGDKIVVTDGFRLYKYHRGKWKDYGLDLNNISELIIDKDDCLWMTTEEGLIKVESEALEYYPKERGMLRYPWTILEDEEENMWFASYHYGLQIMNNQLQYESPKHFKGFEEINNSLHYTGNYYTGGIKRRNGDLLFPMAYRVISFNQQEGFREVKGSFLANNAIQDVKEYNDSLYLAARGLKIIHPDGSSRFYADNDGLDIKELRYIEALEIDKHGIVWMVSHLGLAKFDGKHFSNYYAKRDLPGGLNCVFKDHQQNMWFGGHNGLFFYDYISELPQPIFEDEIEDFKGSIKFISAIDSSYLILGMLDQLILLDLDSFYAGQPNYFIIDHENGFEGQDCIQGTGYRDSKGNVWVATRNTVFKLIPNDIKWINAPSSGAIFHSIGVERPAEDEKTEIIISQKIDSLAYTFFTKTNLQINFGTVDHTNPEKTTYQYRLLNYDQNWSEKSTRRFALYSNLSPGAYVFEVRAVVNNNYSPVQKIRISVVRENWEAFLYFFPWVIGTFLVLLAGSEFNKRRKARKEARALEKELLNKELEHLKLRHSFLLNQASPHFTFNILNAISGLVSKEKHLDAMRYIGMFGDMFRPVLFDDGKITRSLGEEIAFVKNYLKLEKLRFPKKFEYQINFGEDVPLYTFVPKMVIQTFVNNAVKHGLEPIRKDGRLHVELSSSKDFLKIVIEDNGIGRGRAAQNNEGQDKKNGRGIAIIQETLEWFNDQYPEKSELTFFDLTDSRGQALGTKVELLIYARYKNS